MTNLQEMFGKRFKVTDDGTDDTCRAERPWSMELKGKSGTIYPYGQDGSLAIWTAKTSTITKLNGMRDQGVKCIQGGGFAYECAYKFPLALFETIAAIIRPRKRRQMTPEQKAALAAVGFKKKSGSHSGPVSCTVEGTL